MKTVGIIFACVACLAAGIALGFNWQKGNARQTLIKWKYGDAELEIDLDQDLADDETLLGKIFSRDFSEAGALSWLKQEKKVYHFLDRALTTEFAKLDYDSDMADELRELRTRRLGPWSYQSDTVKIGIPDFVDQPGSGYCNVCQSKKYRGKTLKLFDLHDPEREITVEASGRYECPPNREAPDVQLNAADAERLLGFRNFNKYEYALALIVSD